MLSLSSVLRRLADLFCGPGEPLQSRERDPMSIHILFSGTKATFCLILRSLDMQFTIFTSCSQSVSRGKRLSNLVCN